MSKSTLKLMARQEKEFNFQVNLMKNLLGGNKVLGKIELSTSASFETFNNIGRFI